MKHGLHSGSWLARRAVNLGWRCFARSSRKGIRDSEVRFQGGAVRLMRVEVIAGKQSKRRRAMAKE